MLDTRKEVTRILTQLLGVAEDKVTDGAMLVDDLGADSLDVIEVAMELEEAFGIEIPDADIEKVVTVKDLVDYLQKRVSA